MTFNEYRNLGFTTIANGLLAYYSQLGLSDAELLLVLQLEAFGQRGNYFPSNEEIAANTNLNSSEIAALLQKLIEKKFLTIEQTQDRTGKIGNRFNLNKLYLRLDKFLDQHLLIKNKNPHHEQLTDQTGNDPLNSLARKFELEFGRYLSPIEREEIASWLEIDHYQPEIIELALREAVLSQAYNFKYVDRILLNWQRHNLKSKTEIEKFLKRNR
jgi:DNA replication protein